MKIIIGKDNSELDIENLAIGKDLFIFGDSESGGEEENDIKSRLSLIPELQTKKKSVCFNLGIYSEEEVKNNQITKVYHSSGLVGIMPIYKKKSNEENENICEIDENTVLVVQSRWGNPIKMLETVLESDELKTQIDNSGKRDILDPKIMKEEKWAKENISKKDGEVLYGIISDWPELSVVGLDNDKAKGLLSTLNIQSIFDVYQFLEQLECICKRTIKQQSLPHEENLTGKVKGRVLINKQIKTNLSKGRIDRNYCCYNKMSIDNMENRILKYALHLCKKWSRERGDIFSEKIMYCDGILKNVSLVKIRKQDIRNVKNNNAFKEYKKGIKLAANIIERNTFAFDNEGGQTIIPKKVKPFFINMNLLFELYCRVLFEKAIKEIPESRLSLGKYGDRHIYLNNNDKEIVVPKGFQNEHIADIVINKKDENDKDKPFIIVDAKYSLSKDDYYMHNMRENTHQILSYMLLFNAEACGFIYPEEEKNTKEEKNTEVEKETIKEFLEQTVSKDQESLQATDEKNTDEKAKNEKYVLARTMKINTGFIENKKCFSLGIGKL
ncbi:MAG: hypothetical protein UH963_05465 [Agathobacter sp.]|nr:hypothetical protein [Agathobacter sp.]